MGLGPCAPAGWAGLAATGFDHRDRARDAAAPLDLDLTITHRAFHLPGAANQQPVTHGKVAFVDAADLGLLDLRLAVGEPARFGDLDRAGLVQGDLDAAIDHQPVAGGDLARQADALADDQPLAR